MSLYDLYESTIKPAVFEQLDSVFPEFGWKRLGKGWVATNSEHTKRTLGVRADRVICNPTQGATPAGFFVHGTDESVLWTELANGGLKPSGMEFCEVVKDLAARVGVTVELGEEYREQQRIRKEREQRLHVEAQEAHGNLARVTEYWKGRTLGGSIPEWIGGTPDGHLYGAIHDHQGRLVGSFIRRLDGSEPKYQYSEGLNWDELVATNLSAARETREATFVEGILEPFILSPHGVEVQAVGGCLDKLTVERWKRIIKLGIKTVYLMGDNDEPGQKGVQKALSAFRSIDQSDLDDVRVVNPADYQACKDPAELLVQHGASAIHTARSKADHHYYWLAQDLVRRHRAGGWTSASLAQCIRESMDILRSVPRKQWAYAEINFTATLEREVPDYGRIRLQIEAQIEGEREDARRLSEHTRALETAKQLLENPGDVTAFEFATLATRLTDYATAPVNRPSSIDLLERHEQRVSKYRGLEEKIIGLAQRTLPLVDELTCGLRGLMVLVAPPNVGKTALVWQWGLDVIQNNPKAGFVCFSMEMSAEAMLARAICNMAGVGWRNYMFGTLTPQEERRITSAKAKWRSFAGRILILDRSDVEGLNPEAIRRRIRDYFDGSGVERVFKAVDYIQVWPVPEAVQLGAIRGTGATVEGWLMEFFLALVDNDGDDPVVAISTQRKAATDASGNWANGLDTAMGAAIVTYAPDMVLFANPARDDELRDFIRNDCGQEIDSSLKGEAMKKEMQRWRDRLQNDGRSLINLVIAKGRDGTMRGTVPLTFYYFENRFAQGWEWDVFKGHKDNDSELPAGLEDCRKVFGRPAAVESVYTVGDGEGLDDGEPV